MRRLLRLLLPGVPSERAWLPSASIAQLSAGGLEAYVADWIRRAGENPEGVGYADFMQNGMPCGVEIYCDPVRRFLGSIDIDRRLVPVGVDEVRRLVERVVPHEHIIDVIDIGDHWSVQLASSDHFAAVLLLILRDLCSIPTGQELAVSEWWT